MNLEKKKNEQLSVYFMVFDASFGQISPKNYFLAQPHVSKTKQDKKLKPKDLKKILVRWFEILMF